MCGRVYARAGVRAFVGVQYSTPCGGIEGDAYLLSLVYPNDPVHFNIPNYSKSLNNPNNHKLNNKPNMDFGQQLRNISFSDMIIM